MVLGIALVIIVLYVIVEFFRGVFITLDDRHNAQESWKAANYNSPYAAHHMTCGEIDRYAKEARAAREQYDKEHNI